MTITDHNELQHLVISPQQVSPHNKSWFPLLRPVLNNLTNILQIRKRLVNTTLQILQLLEIQSYLGGCNKFISADDGIIACNALMNCRAYKH